MAVAWKTFDEYEWACERYLPPIGEGETMATQLVTAASKLVYKWYNDGDVFDNVNSGLSGWCNDLSSYANWLVKYIPEAVCLYKISFVKTEGEYEDLLLELVKATHKDELLAEYNQKQAVGSVYECEGEFEFREWDDEEDDW